MFRAHEIPECSRCVMFPRHLAGRADGGDGKHKGGKVDPITNHTCSSSALSLHTTMAVPNENEFVAIGWHPNNNTLRLFTRRASKNKGHPCFEPRHCSSQ